MLPDLSEMTIEHSDELVLSIDDLIKPVEEFGESEAWKNSRLSIVAIVKIIQKLDELGQPDLVLQSADTLSAHLSSLDEKGTPVEEYYKAMVARLRMTTSSLMGQSFGQSEACFKEIEKLG